MKRNRTIEEVIEELDRATPELMIEVREMLTFGWETNKRRAAMRQVFGHAFSFGKALYYLDALEASDIRRLALVDEYNVVKGSIPERRMENSAKMAEIMIRSAYLVNKIEVELHIFATCVRMIRRLLPDAAKACGYKIAPSDLQFLSGFTDLRNLFEHIDGSLPGKNDDHLLVEETEDDYGWRVTIALKTDGAGRIVINGKLIDATTFGEQEVRRIIKETTAGMRSSLLAQARKYLEENPDRIPESIPHRPFGLAIDLTKIRF